jgi:anti-anti-sigma factor
VPSFPPDHDHDDLATRGFTVTLSAPRSGAVLLRCAGEIDVCTGPMFGRALDTACGPVARGAGSGVAESGLVVLDLAGITFFSVRGVSVLLAAEETAAARGRRIRVVAASLAVRRVLRVTGTAARFAATVDVVGEPG